VVKNLLRKWVADDAIAVIFTVVFVRRREFVTNRKSIVSNGVCGIPCADTVVRGFFLTDSGGSLRATVDCDFYTIRFRIIKLSHQRLLIPK
jgi:hypothetical protein